MRPVRLVMEGFGAFKQRTEISFEDTDFFALVGPTGAGKSTVVDAICFALYGSVPRYGDERLVGSAMSVGHVETKVQLTFEAGGRRYDAARVVRRGRHGKATTKEARLECDGQILAGRASEMAAAVEQVLGLPFVHFTRCVVLPQGEFARFLHDRPADRQELLVTLLDLRVYERIAQEANRRAGLLDAEARLAEQQLAALAGATPEAVDAARRQAAALASLVERVEQALPRVAELEQALAEHRAEVERLGRLLAGLDAVRVPDEATTLAAAVDEARAALADAEVRQAKAMEAAERAAKALAGLPSPEALRAARQAHDELAAAQAELAAAQKVEADAQRKLRAAAQAEAAAKAEAERATAEHEAARQQYAAHLLAEHLEAGDACPVCGQTVDAPVAVEAPADLAARRQAAEAANDAYEQRRQQHRRAEVAAERARADVESGTKQVRALEAKVAEHPDVAALDVLLAEVEAAQAAERQARADEQAAARAVHQARRQLEAREEAVGAVASGYHRQRDAVIDLAPPPPDADPLASWAALAAWAQDAKVACAARLAAAEAAAQDAATSRAALVDELERAAEGLGVGAGAWAGGDAAALHRAAVRAHATAVEEVGRLERDADTAARLTQQRDEALAQRAVAADLGRLLSARGFERWLVTEALQRLAVGASEVLRQLSRGQFSLQLDDNGDFAVVDHGNGDELRPVRTLSGGETFQASLALALALADELSALAAGGAAKLDAIFLDEGFGSLDADSLDTVAATIEALNSGGRMVGVVTHVRELAARVPVRYEVRRGPATSTVERVVA